MAKDRLKESLADQNFAANVKRQIKDLYKKVEKLEEEPRVPVHQHETVIRDVRELAATVASHGRALTLQGSRLQALDHYPPENTPRLTLPADMVDEGEVVVRDLVTCLRLYPHYNLRYRCNIAAVLRAIRLLRPDVAKDIEDAGADAAYERFYSGGDPELPDLSAEPSPTKTKSVFFATTRAKLEAGLERVGRDLCSYVSAGGTERATCDCKYGIGLTPAKGENAGSEQTGCPEVHMALAMIKAMTDEEYAAILERAGGILP